MGFEGLRDERAIGEERDEALKQLRNLARGSKRAVREHQPNHENSCFTHPSFTQRTLPIWLRGTLLLLKVVQSPALGAASHPAVQTAGGNAT